MVTLHENGIFFIDVNKDDGSTEKVKGIFDMQAIETFSNNRQIPGIVLLGEYFKNGMMPSWYADLILCAVHRTYKQKEHCEFTIDDVLKWITQMGGFASNDMMKLTAHCMKLFVRLNPEQLDEQLQLSDEEKKILGIEIAGSS